MYLSQVKQHLFHQDLATQSLIPNCWSFTQIWSPVVKPTSTVGYESLHERACSDLLQESMGV